MTEIQAIELLSAMSLMQQTIIEFQYVLTGLVSGLVFATSWRA